MDPSQAWSKTRSCQSVLKTATIAHVRPSTPSVFRLNAVNWLFAASGGRRSELVAQSKLKSQLEYSLFFASKVRKYSSTTLPVTERSIQ